MNSKPETRILKLILIGSAPCIKEDMQALEQILSLGEFDFMAIGLDAATIVSHPIQHVATLHPYDLPEFYDRRLKAGLNTDYLAHAHEPYQPPQGLPDRSRWPWPDCKPSGAPWVDLIFPYQPPSGSSALLGVLSAIALGYEKIIVVGCPLDSDRYTVFQRGWTMLISHLKEKVRSMSGWTRELLGAPTKEWINEP